MWVALKCLAASLRRLLIAQLGSPCTRGGDWENGARWLAGHFTRLGRLTLRHLMIRHFWQRCRAIAIWRLHWFCPVLHVYSIPLIIVRRKNPLHPSQLKYLSVVVHAARKCMFRDKYIHYEYKVHWGFPYFVYPFCQVRLILYDFRFLKDTLRLEV